MSKKPQSDWRHDSPAQRAANSARAHLVSKLHGHIIVVLPLDPAATDETIMGRVELVAEALDGLRIKHRSN